MRSGPEDTYETEETELIGDELTLDLLTPPNEGERGGLILEEKAQLVRLPHLEKRSWIVSTNLITPNPKQPRSYFEETKMAELRGSISEHGLQSAINVVPYLDLKTQQVLLLIVDGERRFRVIKQLEMPQILAAVTWLKSEREIFETSIILNEARADHNPIERARAYQRLIEYYIEEEDIGKTEAVLRVGNKLGLSYSTIANSLRLLALHPDIQQMVIDGTLPKYNALNVASALRKFGKRLQQAKLAALLTENPGKDFAKSKVDDTEAQEASDGRSSARKPRITQRAVTEAIQQALVSGGVSEEETTELEAANLVIRFLGALGQLRRTSRKVIEDAMVQSVIDVMRKRRGRGNPPEVVVERIQDTIDVLREVYTKVLKQAITPPLVIPEGAPKFAECIGRRGKRYFSDELRYHITLTLARTSDDGGKLMTAEHISRALKAGGISATPKEVAAIITITGALPKELPSDLRVDTHVLRKRGERGDMKQISGYRLAWAIEEEQN